MPEISINDITGGSPWGLMATKYTKEQIEDMPFGVFESELKEITNQYFVSKNDAIELLGISSYQFNKTRHNLTYIMHGNRAFYQLHNLLEFKEKSGVGE
ncbi:MAG: hypothetical protein AAGB35_10100 [Pseudomonadota bacterium]